MKIFHGDVVGKGKSTYLLSRLCGEKAKGLLWSIGLYLNLPLPYTGAQTGFSGKLLKFYKISCSSLNNHFYWGSVLCFFVGFELTKAGVLLKIGFAYSKPFFVVLWRLKVFFPNLLLCLKAKLAGTSCEYSISTSNMDAFYNKNLHILTKLQQKTEFEKCHIMVFF